MSQHSSSGGDRPVALITGAGSGIGREVALGMAREGHRVVLVGRRTEPLMSVGRETGGDRGELWQTLPADVGDAGKTATLCDRAQEIWGRLDVLVNNAGWSPLTKLADQTPELIEQLYAVNAVGPTILARGAVRIMREAGAGSIVNVSSVASFDPFVGLGVYGAAKAATNTLARAIANEHGEEGIVAYTVAPGAVETELLRSIVDESMLPTEKTLSAGEVAAVIVDCALRRRSEPNGSTITIQSPG